MFPSASPPAPLPAPVRASVLAIGDEVLRGEIVNGNAAFLSDRLFDLGYVLGEHLVVSDEPPRIREALERLTSTADVVMVTGGLGPTDDDRTVDVVAQLAGGGTEVHGPSLEAMKAHFAARGFELTPNNLRQVRVPAGAEALRNPVGIAPGFRVPLGRADAFFLPGVPREMQRIFGDHIVPWLQARLAAAGFPPPAVRTFHVYGMGESHIDHRLAGLVDGLPDVAVHYRTAMPENHVKLVVRGPDRPRNQALLTTLEAEVRRRLGPVVYGVDADTFPLAVARALRAAGATLALAESCTGGYAGQLITTEPGASEVFVGGVVSYANAVKEGLLGVRPETLAAHGAVSEPCAAEMAEGVRGRCGATLGVSVTGIAGADKDGPGAGQAASPGGKEVGTVCFGIAGPRGTRVETRRFTPGRERIRRSAAFHALDLARRYFDDGND
jgi:nicotinamide-nucleotide amidase